MRISATPLRTALCGMAVLALGACTGSVANDHIDQEAFISANIARLSPESAILGGSFYVTDIEWLDENTARVWFEDGHIALVGTTDISEDNGTFDATIIVLDDEQESTLSGASSSISDDDDEDEEEDEEEEEDDDDDMPVSSSSASAASAASFVSASSSY